MPAVAPSILAADFARLGEQVRAVEAAADRVHVDVMDGHFVPNLSMGAAVVEGLKRATGLPLEVHLMVTDPAQFVEGFARAGAARAIFHLEVVPDPRDLIARCRALGLSVGLAVNPDFELTKLTPFIPEIDLALVMTVFPGFGGQPFRPDSPGRIAEVAARITALNPKCELEVDGGIDAETAPAAVRAGATVLVAGTAIFPRARPAGGGAGAAGRAGGVAARAADRPVRVTGGPGTGRNRCSCR